jgi:hypothetical protein
MLGVAKHRIGQNAPYQYTLFRSSGTINGPFVNFIYPALIGGSATAYAWTSGSENRGFYLTAGTWQVRISGTIDFDYTTSYVQQIKLGPFLGIETDSPPDLFSDAIYYNYEDDAPGLAEGINIISNKRLQALSPPYNQYAAFEDSENTITLNNTTPFWLYFNMLPDGVSTSFTATYTMTIACRQTIQ